MVNPFFSSAGIMWKQYWTHILLYILTVLQYPGFFSPLYKTFYKTTLNWTSLWKKKKSFNKARKLQGNASSPFLWIWLFVRNWFFPPQTIQFWYHTIHRSLCNLNVHGWGGATLGWQQLSKCLRVCIFIFGSIQTNLHRLPERKHAAVYYANTNVCFSCVFGEDVHSVCGSHGDFFQNENFICLLKKDDPAYFFLICPQLPLFHSVSLNFSFWAKK